MRTVKTRKKPVDESIGFCRICYTQIAGRTGMHLSMEGDSGGDVVRAIAAMAREYAARAGEAPEDALRKVEGALYSAESEKGEGNG